MKIYCTCKYFTTCICNLTNNFLVYCVMLWSTPSWIKEKKNHFKVSIKISWYISEGLIPLSLFNSSFLFYFQTSSTHSFQTSWTASERWGHLASHLMLSSTMGTTWVKFFKWTKTAKQTLVFMSRSLAKTYFVGGERTWLLFINNLYLNGTSKCRVPTEELGVFLNTRSFQANTRAFVQHSASLATLIDFFPSHSQVTL